MSDTSIQKNYIYNTAYQILVIMTPVITAPYISRVLGAGNIGKVSYESAIASYFVMFAALGSSSYGAREISYYQNDRKRRTEIFWNLIALRIICSSVCLLFYMYYAIVIRQGSQLCIMMALNIVAAALDVTWLFQGLEDFSKIIGKNALFKIAGIIFIFMFVRSRDDMLLYAFGITLLPAAGNISLWMFIWNDVDRPERKRIKPFHDFASVISLFVPTVAVSIYTMLDKTMLGMADSSGIENGYYEQAVKISKMTLTLLTSLGTVMVPRIGFYFMQNDSERIRQYMYRSYRFVWFLGIPLCLGLTGVSDNLVPWFFGQGYEKVNVLIKILAFLILAIGVNNVTGVQYFIPTQRQSLFTATVFLGLAVNAVLNILFVPKMFSIGAAAASVAAEAVIAVSQIMIVRDELCCRDIVRHIPKYLIAGMTMLGVIRMENVFFYPSVLNTAVMVISGAAVYCVMLAVIHDDFFIGLLSTAAEKIIKPVRKSKEK